MEAFFFAAMAFDDFFLVLVFARDAFEDFFFFATVDFFGLAAFLMEEEPVSADTDREASVP
ncbi:MAG TPA: hypothetical protein PLR71_12940 [Deltaproteobacteria bacterium]|nr:hypothetical protein [Deltaproteobacteria bacterium]